MQQKCFRLYIRLWHVRRGRCSFSTNRRFMSCTKPATNSRQFRHLPPYGMLIPEGGLRLKSAFESYLRPETKLAVQASKSLCQMHTAEVPVATSSPLYGTRAFMPPTYYSRRTTPWLAVAPELRKLPLAPLRLSAIAPR